MRIFVIINDRAGTVVGTDANAIADHVADVLAAAGHDAAVSVVKPAQLPAAVEHARRAAPDALIVGGGDGTARSAAAAVLGTRTALGILPLGTINRLARDLGIPIDHKAAVETLAASRVQAIDTADVNGRLFLCNAMLGLTTRFSSVRQELRGKTCKERIRGYMVAVGNLLRSRRRMRINVHDGNLRRRLRVLSLAVTNNVYAEEPSLTMRRQDLAGGVLAVYASQHERGWRMAVAAVRALLGKLRADGNVVRLVAPTFTIDVRGRRSVSISIDGEVEKLATPLVFSIRPQALNVLVPSETR